MTAIKSKKNLKKKLKWELKENEKSRLRHEKKSFLRPRCKIEVKNRAEYDRFDEKEGNFRHRIFHSNKITDDKIK